MVENTRGADHLGVFGDDRFLLVLPHTDADAATIVADRIRIAVAELDLAVGGQAVDVSASVGLSAVLDDDTMFFDTLLSQVEMALEWAKDGGGNTTTRFDRERFLGVRESHRSAGGGERLGGGGGGSE